MALFTRKPTPQPQHILQPRVSVKDDEQVKAAKDTVKNKSKKVVNTAQEFKQMIAENGFTLRIYVAAGGVKHK